MLELIDSSYQDEKTKENRPDYINFTTFDDIAEKLRKEHTFLAKDFKNVVAYMTERTNRQLLELIRSSGSMILVGTSYIYTPPRRVECHRTQFGDIFFKDSEMPDDMWKYVGGMENTDVVFVVGEKNGKRVVYMIKNIKRMEE